MTTVVNSNGVKIEFEATLNLMDDEIREAIAAEGIETEQDFFAAYCKAHLARFGEEFEPDKADGQW